MKKFLALTVYVILSTCAFAQIKYTIANEKWDTDSLGNHRAVITFNGTGNVAKTMIAWRRRDVDPWDKRIIVEDAKTQQKYRTLRQGQ